MSIAARTQPEQRPQQQRSRVTRQRLLDAAVECLIARGWSGTTTTVIAEMAGVSRGAQLHHYPTKNDLVLAAVDHLTERRAAELRTEAARGRAARRPSDSSTEAIRVSDARLPVDTTNGHEAHRPTAPAGRGTHPPAGSDTTAEREARDPGAPATDRDAPQPAETTAKPEAHRTAETAAARAVPLPDGRVSAYLPAQTYLPAKTAYGRANRAAIEGLDDRGGRLADIEYALSLLAGTFTGPLFQAAIEVWVAARTDEALRRALEPLEAKIGRELYRLTAQLLGADENRSEVRGAIQATLELMRGLGVASLLSDDSARRAVILRAWAAHLADVL